MDNRDNINEPTEAIAPDQAGNEGVMDQNTEGSMESMPAAEPVEIASPEPQPSVSQPTPVVPNETDTSEESSMGPIIGAIIIILILIIGGLYFWGQNLVDKEGVTDEDAEEILEDDEVSEELSQQSSSDEVEDIEADLEASSFEDIDSDLENIEDEL